MPDMTLQQLLHPLNSVEMVAVDMHIFLNLQSNGYGQQDFVVHMNTSLVPVMTGEEHASL